MSSKNKEIIEKVNAAFAEGKIEGFLSFCAEDFKWEMVGDQSFTGKEAVREFMKSMENKGMEPPGFTVDVLIAENDTVVACGDLTMKEKDGEEIPYSYCDVYQFRNDEIVSLKSFVVKHKIEGSEQTAAA